MKKSVIALLKCILFLLIGFIYLQNILAFIFIKLPIEKVIEWAEFLDFTRMLGAYNSLITVCLVLSAIFSFFTMKIFFIIIEKIKNKKR
jgi:hypothetical protein